METSTVDNKILEEVVRCSSVIECNGVTEVFVPYFINNGSNEEGCGFFGGNVSGVVKQF